MKFPLRKLTFPTSQNYLDLPIPSLLFHTCSPVKKLKNRGGNDFHKERVKHQSNRLDLHFVFFRIKIDCRRFSRARSENMALGVHQRFGYFFKPFGLTQITFLFVSFKHPCHVLMSKTAKMKLIKTNLFLKFKRRCFRPRSFLVG